MVVVMDPKTGEILALANYPRFNPNTPSGVDRSVVRNRAALDTFEPGSTFKAFVVAAALEERAIKATDAFFCENGAFDVGRNTIHDTHPYGWLNVGKILQVSSNICTAKIAQLLGRERLVDYYQRFGFGQRAGLGLPGEGKGVVPFPKADISLATESFGQGLTATAVQLTAAYGALGNEGVLMQPYLVSKVVDPDGVVLLEKKPTALRQVVSAKSAKTVVSMLELVVEKEGTAPRARMEEYRVAGKTGTAQKVDPVAKGYSDKRIASFIGLVPAEDPRLTIAVVIDEPRTDVYGGIVAAPAFKEIAAAAMPHLGVAPSRPLPAVANAAVVASRSKEQREEPAAREVSQPLLAAFARVEAVTEQVEKGSVRVPDLSGEVGRKAVVRLLAASLEPRLNGTGRVIAQAPAGGTWVEKGTRVTLELAGGMPP
jgi:cell division protein FtsI (penicillin-binding protein 3)